MVCSALIGVAGLWLATAFIAAVFSHQPALGAPLLVVGAHPVYQPWAFLSWSGAYGAAFPKPFAVARLIVLASIALALVPVIAVSRGKLSVKPLGQGPGVVQPTRKRPDYLRTLERCSARWAETFFALAATSTNCSSAHRDREKVAAMLSRHCSLGRNRRWCST